MRRIPCILILLFFSLTAKPQQKKESLLTGNWKLYRMENSQRLLDFEDTLASINHMMAQYRNAQKTLLIPVEDSLQMLDEFRQMLPGANLMRFKIQFKKENSFTWMGSINDPNAVFSGEYEISKGEIAFSSIDSSTKEKQTIRMTLLNLTPNKLIFKMPVGKNPESAWTLSFKKL